MTQLVENREVTATVESVGAVENGQVQIKIKSQEVGAVRYPIPLFLPESCGAQAGYDYPAVLSRGKLKRDKDGSYDNHYFWNAVEWNGEPVSQQRQQPQQPSAPQAPTQAPGGPSEPRSEAGGTVPSPPPVRPPGDIDRREAEKRESIHAQVALRAAVELAIAFPLADTTLSSVVEAVGYVVRDFRRLLAEPDAFLGIIEAVEPEAAEPEAADTEDEVVNEDPFA
tara:strand:+ start:432 stop:1106 length:675 start_codon:yes stop_codon:yes gene_type:complete